MIQKILRTAFLCLLGVALLAYPIVTTTFPLSNQQILGLLVGFAAFVFWYFDGRLSAVLVQIDDALKDHITEANLNEVMARAAKTRTHWTKVRIIASSTGQIQPLFFGEKFTADEVRIIVRGLTVEEKQKSSMLADFDRTIENTIALWQELKKSGRIKNLHIQQYPFFPIEYNVIFDDRILIAGLLIPEAGRISDVRVADPTITINKTASAAREIRKYIERFDGLWNFINTKVTA